MRQEIFRSLGSNGQPAAGERTPEGGGTPSPLLRVQLPASRRKPLFGETPNTTREDAYAPQTPCRYQHSGTLSYHLL